MNETLHSPTIRTFSVPGVSCGHCKTAIETGLGALAGVERADVDLERKIVSVLASASDDAIVATIDDAGYDATRLDP